MKKFRLLLPFVFYFPSIYIDGVSQYIFLLISLLFSSYYKIEKFLIIYSLFLIVSCIMGAFYAVNQGHNLYIGAFFSLVSLIVSRQILFLNVNDFKFLFWYFLSISILFLLYSILKYGSKPDEIDLYLANGGRNLYSGLVLFISCLLLLISNKNNYIGKFIVCIFLLVGSYLSFSRSAIILSLILLMFLMFFNNKNRLLFSAFLCIICYFLILYVDFELVLLAFGSGLNTERSEILASVSSENLYDFLLGGYFPSGYVGIGYNLHNSIYQSIYVYGPFGLINSLLYIFMFCYIMFMKNIPYLAKSIFSIIFVRSLLDSLLIFSFYDFFIYVYFFYVYRFYLNSRFTF